ncbi:unnamed protein product [Heligmosomoides polygyrus]|uniref:PI3K/PI4K domain-containing protein n=1 Tax=Heligmosomoides polygyrus TaxID=6339 RepID=A0A183GU83_HELPZ|nr:unnamed protein product [Heligmosomoides polygyrus]
MEGGVVHVDFNLIFHKGEYLPVREVVPFRLTRNMINGFGPTGVEGPFRRSCESTLRVMRDNKDTLLTVIQTFVHDPLLEWINTEARAQQNKGRGQLKLHAPSTESVQLILKRLEGHIVSPEVSLLLPPYLYFVVERSAQFIPSSPSMQQPRDVHALYVQEKCKGSR